MMISYRAERFSSGRTTVMGLATALILWFHCDVVVPEGSLLQFFKWMGDIGVEMFLLASGVGLYFAVEKHPSYGDYLKSRCRRMLPVFLPVTFLWCVYKMAVWGEGGVGQTLWKLSTMSFWVNGDLSCWYVASIFLLYLVTPVYIRVWKKHPAVHSGVILAVYLFDILVVQRMGVLAHLAIFLYRIPTFLFGLSLGKAIAEKRVIQINIPIVVILAGGCMLLVASCFGMTGFSIPWAYKYFVYGPLAVILSIACSLLPTGPVTNFLGKRSLEIYLLFEKVQEFLCYQPAMWALEGKTKVLFCLVALAVTLVCAEVLARGTTWLMRGSGRKKT